MADNGLPDFQPVDFSDLHELIQVAQAGGASSSDDPVVAALELGVRETERVAADIDQRLDVLEEESVGDYVASFQSFEDLHREIQATDGVLERMERMLGSFQTDLSGISDEIRMLQGDSLAMNVKLRNRRSLQGLMSEYVSSVVVSPNLVRQISEEEINENYLEYLTELNKKLDHMKQNDMQKLPSCAQSAPELERLRTKAVARIKEFLLSKINALKKPKTNLQILQRNVLVRFKFFNTFLGEHHGMVADEVKQHYVQTMSSVYLKQFRTYETSLQKLELEYSPTKADLLVNHEGTSAGGVGGRLLDGLGLGRSVKLENKGNVFSLSGRDAILQDLEKDPIIAHTHRDKAKYYHEQLFRSHQMLLMDTATSEFLFLNDFFDTKGDHTLFAEVFNKTTQYFTDSLETFLSNCWDSVGLLLMIRIVEFYRRCMQRRQVSCLDSYLDALQLLLWPRLRVVLDANVASLRKAATTNHLTAPNTHPHTVTRRYAELAASLHALSSSESSGSSETLQPPLHAMQQEVCTLLATMSSSSPSLNQESSLVFLVNNYDLVLTVFHERHLPRSATIAFEDLLREQGALFVESQLLKHYPELVKFVKAAEPAVADLDENRDRAGQAMPPGVDMAKMEQVVKQFGQHWKAEMDRIHKYVMTSFTNFSNGMEILKQVFTQLLLYYTRLQQVIQKICPNGNQALNHELVPNTTIIMEIKQYSRNF